MTQATTESTVKLTINQASHALGKTAKWSPAPGIVIPVELLDLRQVYGRIEYRIRPLSKSSSGTAWARMTSLDIAGKDLSTVPAERPRKVRSEE